MIKGMTGFGQAQVLTGRVKALIEIKSVNQRYLDINYFLPVGFGAIENKIRQMIQKQIRRGRVTVSMKIIQKGGQEVVLNKDVARKEAMRYVLANIDYAQKGLTQAKLDFNPEIVHIRS